MIVKIVPIRVIQKSMYIHTKDESKENDNLIENYREIPGTIVIQITQTSVATATPETVDNRTGPNRKEISKAR